jgi:plasmid stabilization system protein ParE
MYKIIISPLAMEDLENISNYISSDNPLVAQKVIEKIFDTISNISIFPNI